MVTGLVQLLPEDILFPMNNVYACLLTLEIESAFTSVRRTDILRLLEEFGVEHYILCLTGDYLWHCSIILHEGEHYFKDGVPKGSYLVPILRFVVIDILLMRRRRG